MEEWFLQQLSVIDHAIAFVCRRYKIRDADAEDFASAVKLRLIENDYAILRRFSGRSSFAAFIGITVRRMLLDQRIHEWGRWRPSVAAKRMGDAGVQLECLLYRDRRTLEEAIPILSASFDLKRPAIERMAERLPVRLPRPRNVDLENVDAEVHLSTEAIERDAFAADRLATAHRVAAILRENLSRLASEDRYILSLRFFSGMNVSEIARSLRMNQKLLYRRIDRHLRAIRLRLEEVGINGNDIDDVLGSLPEIFAAPTLATLHNRSSGRRGGDDEQSG